MGKKRKIKIGLIRQLEERVRILEEENAYLKLQLKEFHNKILRRINQRKIETSMIKVPMSPENLKSAARPGGISVGSERGQKE